MIRQRFLVEGVVQGVGFRPFVHRQATALGIVGWVANTAAGVTIEAQASAEQLQTFHHQLLTAAPIHARVTHIHVTPRPLSPQAGAFNILPNQLTHSGAPTLIGPDLPTCPACLSELFDPNQPRYRYPFINCTDCGPRYTIAHSLPYDRAATSMSAFPMCPSCQAEYDAPASRRFHAEPNACPVCGPTLLAVSPEGQPLSGDPIALAVSAIRAGQIVAMKGLGGFHLACDAQNAEVVARLRARKRRPDKPFALMCANLASLAPWAHYSPEEAALLESPVRPIVLLTQRSSAKTALAGIAPGLPWLGWMLPYTPLHHLLFHHDAGQPTGQAWQIAAHPLLLVMTSANVQGEPIITDNEAALRDLRGIADCFLLHNRDIVVRCDDSVAAIRPDTRQPVWLRRGRGCTPAPLPLPDHEVCLLALGGHYKNTIGWQYQERAVLSEHIGDLDRTANCDAHSAAVTHFQHLLKRQPDAICHDAHPDFFSTQWGQQFGAKSGVPAWAIQHHHAHIAAVLAEHAHSGPVLGLALDGVGWGEDGTLWGGELLQVTGDTFQRLGHLRTLPLPGGDQAARAPWRMAAAALAEMGRTGEIAPRFADQAQARPLASWLAQRPRLPQTSSMGRWFDAAAGLLGLCSTQTFEGQAPMLLEGLASTFAGEVTAPPHYRFQQNPAGHTVLDLLPLLKDLLDHPDRTLAEQAARFHITLCNALADWVVRMASQTGLSHVACAGGCFANRLLAQGVRQRLLANGLIVLESLHLPPNDGALALGQLWVGQHRLRAAHSSSTAI